MNARLLFGFYAFLCATFLFNICSCATVPKEKALKLKDFHAEETKAFGNGALTGGVNSVKGHNNDGDEDEVEWAEEEENEGEEDFEDFDEETEEEFANDGDDEDVDKENEDVADDDEDDEWTEKEGEDYVDEDEDEGDHGVDDEHADGENNEYDDDEDGLMDEEYAIDDEEDGHDVPKQLSNVSEDDDGSPEDPAITEKTLELANAHRKGILTALQFEIIE